jgi:hypothetical protein
MNPVRRARSIKKCWHRHLISCVICTALSFYYSINKGAPDREHISTAHMRIERDESFVFGEKRGERCLARQLLCSCRFGRRQEGSVHTIDLVASCDGLLVVFTTCINK